MTDDFYKTRMGHEHYQGTMKVLANSTKCLADTSDCFLKEFKALRTETASGFQGLTDAVISLANEMKNQQGLQNSTQPFSEERMEYPLMVKVPYGVLYARISGQKDEAPGIEIGFVPKDSKKEINLCVAECPVADGMDNAGNFVVHVWNADKEDPETYLGYTSEQIRRMSDNKGEKNDSKTELL